MDSLRYGHVKLSRKFFANAEASTFWGESRRFSRFEALLDCIQMAQWRDYSHHTNAGTIELRRGEFVASLRHLGRRWKWSTKKVKALLAVVEKRGLLRQQRETQAGFVYLVVDYDASAQREPAEETPTATPTETQRKQTGNKNKKEKKGEAVIPRDAKRLGETWLTPYDDAWKAQYGGALSGGRLAAALSPLHNEHGPIETLQRWSRYLNRTMGTFASPEKFAATWGMWSGHATDTPNARPARVLAATEML